MQQASGHCPRCGSANPPHMRFCNSCGFLLGGAPPAQAAVPQVPVSPMAMSPLANPSNPSPLAPARPMNVQPASVCWRCRSLGETGADFCKFCGARYADGAAQSPSPGGNVGAALVNYAQQPAAQPMQQAPQAPAPIQHAQQQPAVSPPNYMQAAPGTAPVAQFEAQRTAMFGTLVAILKDGSDGRAYPITDDPTDVGRSEGHILLSDDPYLSPRHVRLVPRADGLLVRDLDSLNGVYVRLRDPVELFDGDTVLLGQQLLRFEVLPETELPLGPAMHRGVLVFGTPEVPRLARLVQYTTEGVGRDVHYLYRDESVIGREQGDIVCTDDPFMSRRHAAVALDRSARRFVLRDLGSSNGTAVRVRGERLLRPGDQFRIGRHLFRYDRAGAQA